MSEFQSAYYQRMYEGMCANLRDVRNKLEQADRDNSRMHHALTRVMNYAPASYEASIAREALGLGEMHANHPN